MSNKKHQQNNPNTETTANSASIGKARCAAPSADLKAAVLAALEELFKGGEWEIPDDFIEGKVTGRIQQLEARVSAQANRIAELQAKVEGKPAPTGRADALEKNERRHHDRPLQPGRRNA